MLIGHNPGVSFCWLRYYTPVVGIDEIQHWFDENAPELKSPVTGQTHVYTMISARRSLNVEGTTFA